MSQHQHHFVQAPIRPLDEDGLSAALVGTAGFAVATLVLWLRRGHLAAAGHGWWPWTGVAGLVLGLALCAWCTWRQRRRRVAPDAGSGLR